MRVRLVRVTTKSGARAERASLVDADVVTIGRGSDNVVQLSGLDVSLRHAVLHLRSGEVFIEPVGGNRLDVNGRTSLEGRALRPDREVRFGSHVLRLRRASLIGASRFARSPGRRSWG
jgi:pSer/pThr/pTyr-binding forkhead associated (FHA) protein